MLTEKEKMLADELYHAQYPQQLTERLRAQLLFKELNATLADQPAQQSQQQAALPQGG